MIKIKTDNRAIARSQKMSTITEYFKHAAKPSEVVSAVQEEVAKQLSEKKESVKRRAYTGHGVSQKN